MLFKVSLLVVEPESDKSNIVSTETVTFLKSTLNFVSPPNNKILSLFIVISKHRINCSSNVKILILKG